MDPFVSDPIMQQKPKPKINMASFKIDGNQLKGAALSGLSGSWGFAIGTLLLALVTFLILDKLLSAIFSFVTIPSFSSFPGPLSFGSIAIVFALGFMISIVTGLISSAIASFLKLCASWAFLDFVRGEDSKVTDIFKPFYNFRARNLQAVFLVDFFIFLWTLLLVVPGIIKRYSYSQTSYILKDNPNLSATQAITLSREMMDGHKAELLALEVSFIGWFFLSILTLGIGLIWLAPYYVITKALYYDNLKKGYEAGYKQSMNTSNLIVILIISIVIPAIIILLVVTIRSIGVHTENEFKKIGQQMQKTNKPASAHHWQNKKRTNNKELEKAFEELAREMMK